MHVVAAAVMAGAAAAPSKANPGPKVPAPQEPQEWRQSREVHLPLSDKDENDVVIKAEELPQAIRDYIAKELPDSKITEARKDYGNKEHKGEKFVYEVDVTQGKKEYALKFDREGKLLKKREEAGDEPGGR